MAQQSQEEFNALQQAAEWFATLSADSAGEKEQAAWQAWLDAAPMHRAAWEKVEAVSRKFSGLDEPLKQTLSARARRRTLLKSIAWLCAGGLGLAAFRQREVRSYIASAGADYRTGVGEIRAMALPDSSLAWLNTDSAADLKYDQELRRLVLHRGEILIHTRPDLHIPSRPLVVDVPQARLYALGTRFSVRLLPDSTHLAVFEGAVRIEPAEGLAGRVVSAGEQIEFGPAAANAIGPASENDSAWTRHRLVATQQPLHQVLSELARYRRGQLVCDPAIAQLRVVGSYPLDDTGRALQMLAASLPVRIDSVTPWWVSVRPR